MVDLKYALQYAPILSKCYFDVSHLKKGVGSEQFVNRTFVSSEPSE